MLTTFRRTNPHSAVHRRGRMAGAGPPFLCWREKSRAHARAPLLVLERKNPAPPPQVPALESRHNPRVPRPEIPVLESRLPALESRAHLPALESRRVRARGRLAGRRPRPARAVGGRHHECGCGLWRIIR